MPEPYRMFKVFTCRQCFRDFDGEEVQTCPKCNPTWGQCLCCGYLEGRGHSMLCDAKPEGSCPGCGMPPGTEHRKGCLTELGFRMAMEWEQRMLDAILGVPDSVRELD